MKSLYEYLIESQEAQTGTFTFDFSKFENVKDTLSVIVDKLGDHVTDKTDTSITISCTTEDKTEMNEAISMIKDLVSKNCHSTKRSSDESFAQYCKKQEDELKRFEDFFEQPEEDEDKDKKKSDNKDNDEAE